MKNNMLVAVLLPLVALNLSIGAMEHEVFEKHEFEVLNPTVAHRVKHGQITEICVKPSVSPFAWTGVFRVTEYAYAYFNNEGTVFKLFKEAFEPISFDMNGNIVLSVLDNHMKEVRLNVASCQTFDMSNLNPSVKDLVNACTAQNLYRKDVTTHLQDPEDVYATLRYDQQKSPDDMFIFDHPIYNNELTMPLYSQGLVCAITSKFPLEVQQGSVSDRLFNGLVIYEIEKNKHVCLYEIKDKKLVLLRDLGNFPYCVGCYVNPQKTVVAVLYGNNINEPKCLKFIKFNYPALLLSSKAQDTFSDIFITCEK